MLSKYKSEAFLVHNDQSFSGQSSAKERVRGTGADCERWVREGWKKTKLQGHSLTRLQIANESSPKLRTSLLKKESDGLVL